MTTYAPVAVTLNGVAATYNAAAAGDKVSGPGDNVWITVKNGSGSPITLTITPPGNNAYGVAYPAKTFSIAATGEKDVPILALYGDPSDSGNVALSWSSTTTVTWAAKRI